MKPDSPLDPLVHSVFTESLGVGILHKRISLRQLQLPHDILFKMQIPLLRLQCGKLVKPATLEMTLLTLFSRRQ